MKNILKSAYHKVANNITWQIRELLRKTEQTTASEQSCQLVLKNQYKQLSLADLSKYPFAEVGFRTYSQNSEDGILLFLFSILGTVNKTAVEICASDGIQCNTANLIINHGWRALMFDGDANAVAKGRKFYRSHPDTFSLPPVFEHAWITRDNVNRLITDQEIYGEIDLLSIDMDGVDYWIWDAITCISPRVVVAEVQCIWGSEKSVTVPYDENFKTQFINNFGVYSGASIAAFVKLAKKKNYRLVGFEKYGFNAFFIRNDVGADAFPEITLKGYDDIPFVTWAKKEFMGTIQDMIWQEV
jgi:hypothetical protein